MLDFHGLCCWIAEGPTPDYHYDSKSTWNNLWTSVPDVDDVGGTGSVSYSPEISASANNLRLTQDIGPVVEDYDPEWAAWLAGEI